MNYTGKINLVRFKNACVISVKGASATKRGVFIPIEDNNIFVSADDSLKVKGAYVNINVWEKQSPSKYGSTHSIRQSLPKEVRDLMTDDELKAVPYIGDMKPFEIQNQSATVDAPQVDVMTDYDDLPF